MGKVILFANFVRGQGHFLWARSVGKNLEFQVQGLELRVQGLGLRVQDVELRLSFSY